MSVGLHGRQPPALGLARRDRPAVGHPEQAVPEDGESQRSAALSAGILSRGAAGAAASSALTLPRAPRAFLYPLFHTLGRAEGLEGGQRCSGDTGAVWGDCQQPLCPVS